MLAPEYWPMGRWLAQQMWAAAPRLKTDPQLRDLLPQRFKVIPLEEVWIDEIRTITSFERQALTRLVQTAAKANPHGLE